MSNFSPVVCTQLHMDTELAYWQRIYSPIVLRLRELQSLSVDGDRDPDGPSPIYLLCLLGGFSKFTLKPSNCRKPSLADFSSPFSAAGIVFGCK